VPAPPSAYGAAASGGTDAPAALALSCPRNPFSLPAAYASALQDRQSRALRNRLLIDRASLAPLQRAQLQQMIQAEFALWVALNYPQGVLHNAAGVDRERAAALAQAQAQAQAQAAQRSPPTAAATAAVTALPSLMQPSTTGAMVVLPAGSGPVPFQPTAASTAAAAATATAPGAATAETRLSAAAQLQQTLLLQEKNAHANGHNAQQQKVLQSQ